MTPALTTHHLAPTDHQAYSPRPFAGFRLAKALTQALERLTPGGRGAIPLRLLADLLALLPPHLSQDLHGALGRALGARPTVTGLALKTAALGWLVEDEAGRPRFKGQDLNFYRSVIATCEMIGDKDWIAIATQLRDLLDLPAPAEDQVTTPAGSWQSQQLDLLAAARPGYALDLTGTKGEVLAHIAPVAKTKGKGKLAWELSLPGFTFTGGNPTKTCGSLGGAYELACQIIRQDFVTRLAALAPEHSRTAVE